MRGEEGDFREKSEGEGRRVGGQLRRRHPPLIKRLYGLAGRSDGKLMAACYSRLKLPVELLQLFIYS